MVNVNDRIMGDFLFLTCFFQIFLLSVLFLVLKKHTFLLSYLIRLYCADTCDSGLKSRWYFCARVKVRTLGAEDDGRLAEVPAIPLVNGDVSYFVLCLSVLQV